MVYIVKIPEWDKTRSVKGLRRLAHAQKVKFAASDKETVVFTACPVSDRVKMICAIEEILSQCQETDPYLVGNYFDEVILIRVRRK